MTLAQDERAALVDTLRSVGPDAPTLCEGWTTRDLVAHLVVRERRPDTGPGIMIKQFAGHTERVRADAAAGSWQVLLDQLASGPPTFSPFKLVDRWANLAEMFVHHEDVLRGGTPRDAPWTPRPLSADMQEALLTPAKSMAKLTLKGSPASVTLTTTDGRELVTSGSGKPVVVTGTAGELVLFAFGRAPLDVTYEGDGDSVSAVMSAKRGF
ncbi:TIGR03085 family metal-binding protein [Gordonia sp. SL306]|uniref:TIGR03085 family metal-binding protein n=1 Tax=Gordonia sp. SL306 TaxID=2995145 RepID=UPI00226DE17F|nr:TIGR03085 family metal-binding protein [Gordonia sp. SL306]WAC55186.1 TIGR03085 family metal-binding protein [Gordonia sp. SL306]